MISFRQISLVSIACILGHLAQSQIQASFTMDVNKGCPPLMVQFTNTTPGGTFNSYQWDFGDGDTSTAISPTHTYQMAGDFIVTLNGFGSDFMPLITALDSVSATSVSFSVLPEICLVTVDSTSTQNVIVWEKPTDPAVAAVNIYRESDSSWILVGTIPQTDLSKLVDQNVFPNDSSYSYRIAYVDTCGNESPISGIHTTMHLVSYLVGADVHLTWVSYTGFGFTSASVLRDTTGMGNFIMLDSLPPGMVNYVDSNPPANSEYIIEIVHPAGCTASKVAENHNSSRSNKATMANPGGVSEGISDSKFQIYPNPNDGTFTIEFNASLSPLSTWRGVGGEVKIYNLLGEEVYQLPITDYRIPITIKLKQPSGIYYLHILHDSGVMIKKVVVE